MRFPSNHWLTRRRLRAHGLILALCLWSVYLWNMSGPGLRDRTGNLKGTDFLHFYTSGSLARAHDARDLYDVRAQSRIAAGLLPAAKGIYYLPLYPPQVSFLFAPLARFSYERALALWVGLTFLFYGICNRAVWRSCPNLRSEAGLVMILALAFPAFWHLVAWGQTSALALICFTLAFFALRAKHEFVAGLAFGCLIFKPQLGLGAAIVFVSLLCWRVIAGAFVSASAQLLIGAAYYGLDSLRRWLHTLLALPAEMNWLEPRIYQTHCLRTFCSMIVPWPMAASVLYLTSAVMVCAMLVSCWRSRAPLAIRFSALLFATVLLAPHLTVYDLVILSPSFLLLSDWLMSQSREFAPAHFGALLYCAFLLPLFGPTARWTHVQLSVPIFGLILYHLWTSGRAGQANPALILASVSE